MRDAGYPLVDTSIYPEENKTKKNKAKSIDDDSVNIGEIKRNKKKKKKKKKKNYAASTTRVVGLAGISRFSPLVPESSRLRSDNAGPATNELWTPLLAGGFGFGSGFRSRSRRPLEDAVDGSLPIRMGLASPSMTAGCLSSTYPRHFRQPSKSINACMQPHSVTFCCNHSNRTG